MLSFLLVLNKCTSQSNEEGNLLCTSQSNEEGNLLCTSQSNEEGNLLCTSQSNEEGNLLCTSQSNEEGNLLAKILDSGGIGEYTLPLWIGGYKPGYSGV